jgi:hypothetical protein
MKSRYKITQENGVYKIQKWLDENCTGEMDKNELNEILGLQLHAQQLTGKVQRMLKKMVDESGK